MPLDLLTSDTVPTPEEIEAYSRMVDRVKFLPLKELEAVWEAIKSPYSYPELGYQAGNGITFPFEYWSDLVYAELTNRRIKTTLESLK